ncbi:ATP-binding protein [uncultured Kordia sp.]|uniref:AAA family ATPase n=1 Tax=uncultured Kordia sp. TaxID=507699 RepID=UPI0026187E7A|nr:ATP-binding protein [uncultured Kordia sp.]
MRIDKVYIDNFKNLNDFFIDINETKLHTILIGQNAAGKSNFIEALVLIFRDLDLENETEFNYEIEYRCSGNFIKAIGGKSIRGKYQLYLGKLLDDGTVVYPRTVLSKKKFKANKDEYLPKHVFSYYSGISNRLLEHFDKHQIRFRNDLLKGIDHPIRKLFYTRHIHSHFVLMAFFSFSDSKIQEFLEEFLDIVGLESVLFVFKEPNWKRNNDSKDFWGAGGLVRKFLEDLWAISMAPIVTTESVRLDFVKKTSQQQLYLYISNLEKLQNLANRYSNHSLFFKTLESTYVSDLIEEVRIKVRKRNTDGTITFKELSEGEQQLLTVLGLIRFTKENESLFLLDEPDTHLNPLWKWKYMSMLEDLVDENDNSQIIMTTHDPLVIGGLTKEEIRVFQSVKKIDDKGKEYQKVEAFQPDFDPQGLGVAGILTSEFFNLPSSLDLKTEAKIVRQYELLSKERHGELTEFEVKELFALNDYLNEIGFNQTSIDPLYDKFIDELLNIPDFTYNPKSEEEKVKHDEIIKSVLKKITSK